MGLCGFASRRICKLIYRVTLAAVALAPVTHGILVGVFVAPPAMGFKSIRSCHAIQFHVLISWQELQMIGIDALLVFAFMMKVAFGSRAVLKLPSHSMRLAVS